MRKLSFFIASLFISAYVFAGSTINPSVPTANSSLSSAPLRINFSAAYADINNILSQFASNTSPPTPSRYQYWLDTSASPSMLLKIYDGASWVSVARLNTSTHTWSVIGSYTGSPISTTYGGTGADLHTATGAVSMSSGTTTVGTLPASYLAAPLTSLSTFNTNGMMTQTAANTFTARTVTGTANELTVTNGSGVSGNPTISLPSALTFTGKTITGGTYVTPNISTISNTGTLTLPTSTDTLVGRATTDTLTNKTFVAPVLGTPASGVATNLTGTAAGLTAGNVTTNANLTGVITSSGNATSIASQTGTGTKFVVDTSPTLVTPNIGAATATSINFGGSTLATYAVGTWTPTITFVTPGDLSVTYSTQVGTYTVIGNRVFLNFNIITSAFTYTTASGNMRINGIPFTSDATTGNNSTGECRTGGIVVSGYSQIVSGVGPNLAFASLLQTTSPTGLTPGTVNTSLMPSGNTIQIQCSVTYQI